MNVCSSTWSRKAVVTSPKTWVHGGMFLERWAQSRTANAARQALILQAPLCLIRSDRPSQPVSIKLSPPGLGRAHKPALPKIPRCVY